MNNFIVLNFLKNLIIMESIKKFVINFETIG